ANGPPGPLTATQAKQQQEAAAKDFERSVEIENSVGMKLRFIPPGRFLMGSPSDEPNRRAHEGPRHVRAISLPFCLGTSGVRQKEKRKVREKTPAFYHRETAGRPDHRPEQVRWADPGAFCNHLPELPEKKVAGRRYRLPTEAEWEYACRAGTQT